MQLGNGCAGSQADGGDGRQILIAESLAVATGCVSNKATKQDSLRGGGMLDAAVNNPQVLAAVVAGGVSVVVSLLSNIYSPIAQRRLERTKGEIQKEIESVRTELATITSEKNARRAYEYETRKRLYE
ncbi:hypothetical protein [Rhizobium ruizarguesonis]|uniref:hypothetical protein n=1 Tax=Rhizobium ruizarguesonis TaxID=2081791 RepID=UPI001030BD13|nr:hypothetical protein [Rhizobium ruizarguesonis]TBD81051.1 hypothetical protein ELH11_14685 [Rhizobium ruizarguesonis]TBE12212.1 hypothetical protein ELH09_14765 [Rhizobium ruizarguesonis]WSH32173.1 hypothetical protein U8P70_16615 [Rhizobium ruizarguesonis]